MWLTLAIWRVLYLVCKLVRQVKVGFADARRTCTKAFERCAPEVSQQMTIQDVATIWA